MWLEDFFARHGVFWTTLVEMLRKTTFSKDLQRPCLSRDNVIDLFKSFS